MPDHNLTIEQEFGLIIDRHVAMEANAGSGKTKVLTDRYLDLVTRPISDGEPYQPKQIAAITFTEKAASEMKERISSELEKLIAAETDSDKLNKLEEVRYQLGSASISTFHSFYNKIIRDFADLIDMPKAFSIATSIEQQAMVDEVAENLLGSLGEDSEVQEFFLYYSPATIAGIFKEYIDHGIKTDLDSYDNTLNNIRLFIVMLLNDFHSIYNDYLDNADKTKLNQKNCGLISSAFNLPSDTYDEAVDKCNSLYNLIGQKIEGRSSLNSIVFSFGSFLKKEKIKGVLESLTVRYEQEDHQRLERLVEILNIGLELLISKKKELGLITHNDTMLFAYELIDNHPDVALTIKSMYKEFLIDEFQDTAPLQVNILKPILSLFSDDENDTDNRLFIVGDPKQSIYGFRNADIRVFLQFIDRIKSKNELKYDDNNAIKTTRKKLNNISTQWQGKVPLSVTFRCPPVIIDFVNTVFTDLMVQNEYGGVDYLEMIYGRKGESDTLDRGSLGVVIVQKLEKEAKEKAEKDANEPKQHIIDIANLCERLLTQPKDADSVSYYKPGDLAVIMHRRTHFHDLSQELAKRSIPYNVIGSRNFYYRREVIETIAYLRFLIDTSDNIALASVLTSYYHGLVNSDLVTIKHISDSIAESTDTGLQNDTLWDRVSFFVDNYREYKFRDTFSDIIYKKTKKAYELILTVLPLIQRVATSELMQILCNRSDLKSYLQTSLEPEKSYDNIQQLIDEARDLQDYHFFDLSKFVDLLYQRATILEDEKEATDSSDNRVSISTVHQTKGLEYNVVLYDCASNILENKFKNKIQYLDNGKISFNNYNKNIGNDQIGILSSDFASPLKHKYKLDQDYKLREESIRLAYVACTRAKEKLYLILDESNFKGYLPFRKHSAVKLGLDDELLQSTLDGEDYSETQYREINSEIKVYYENSESESESYITDHQLKYDIEINTSRSLARMKNIGYADKVPDSFHNNDPGITTQKGTELSDKELTAQIGGRIFFPTNLIIAAKDPEAYIEKYILGFHEMDYITENYTDRDSNNSTALRNLEPMRYIHEHTHADRFDSISKLQLPRMAYGTLIHAVLERITDFTMLDIDQPAEHTVDTEKLVKWLNSNGIEILKDNSDSDLDDFAFDSESDILLYSNIISKVLATVPSTHLFHGEKEKTLYKSIIDSTQTADKKPDILGGKIDLYHIDKENGSLYAYDWKIVSGVPSNSQVDSHLSQLKYYLYLLWNLSDKSDHIISGSIVYIVVSDKLIDGKFEFLSVSDIEVIIKNVSFSLEDAKNVENTFIKTIKAIDSHLYHQTQF
jgi:ATP-dependent exoDNAse (exonuclease V) beta subunit